MPPKGWVASAKPPIQKSTLFRPPRAPPVKAPVAFMKSTAALSLTPAALASSRACAAARFPSIVVATVMLSCVP